MRIGIAQLASPDGEEPRERHARVLGMADRFAGCDLVVLPELWSVGFCHYDRYAESAEDLDGPTYQTGRRLAEITGARVHVGSAVVRGEDGALRNTAFHVDPDGRVGGVYSKVHVFGYRSREAGLLSPGSTVVAEELPWGVTSSVTCYDLRFPGIWEALVEHGVEFAIVPAAWPAARLRHWDLLTRARALENQMVVVAANAAGTHGGVEQAGHSRVVGPDGEVIAELDQAETVLTIDVDPSTVRGARAGFPLLRDRLPDYSILQTTGRSDP